ncbi:MAG: hypothetical protein HQL75_07675 [Magnetococcales bacterium]|nr:hypothetical protein [Magnetococcales bacterium]
MIIHPMKDHWRNCVRHENDHVSDFVKHYFTETRQVLLIAGAGFDPRSRMVTELLSPQCTGRIKGIFLREERLSTPDPGLKSRADQNEAVLRQLVPNYDIFKLNIFASDGAVILGTELQKLINNEMLVGITDIVFDVSAISLGVCFTLARMLLKKCHEASPCINMHLFLSFHPGIDADIRTDDDDRISTLRGYLKPNALEEDKNKARLWIPILSKRKRAALIRIREKLRDDQDDVDICPVLPFPTQNPGIGDSLVEAFQSEFENAWDVDYRNIIYAAEDDPLDLYETILKLYDKREKAFGGLNGSQIILSPGGSKVLALGAMLAAIALDLPVLYVEDVSYHLGDSSAMDQRSQASKIVHLWLLGDAYPAG